MFGQQKRRPVQNAEPAPRPSGIAAASIILGITSIVVGFSVWGSAAGIICGAIGLILGLRCRHESEAGKAGFLTSLIGFAISICVAGLFLPSFFAALQQGAV